MAEIIDFNTRYVTGSGDINNVPNYEVDQDIIRRIEDVLELAKKGEITGFAYSMSLVNDEVGSGYVFKKGEASRLGGTIMWLFHRFGQKLAE